MRPPASRGHYQEDHDRHGDDRVDVSNAQKIKRWSCRQRPRTRGRRLRPQLQPAAPAEGLTGRVRRLAPRAARTTRPRHRLSPLTVGDGLASLGGCRPLHRDYDGVTREIWRLCTVPGSPGSAPGGFAPLARWEAHRAFGGRWSGCGCASVSTRPPFPEGVDVGYGGGQYRLGPESEELGRQKDRERAAEREKAGSTTPRDTATLDRTVTSERRDSDPRASRGRPRRGRPDRPRSSSRRSNALGSR